MKNACRHLGIISKHFVHFGRSAGSVKAELDELDGYIINELGNRKWILDVMFIQLNCQ
jgi:ribosomal protein L16 Arg81 hydroxylase